MANEKKMGAPLRFPGLTGDPTRDRVIMLRRARGWSQADLGERLGGLSHVAVGKWESGKAVPSGPALKLLEQLEKEIPMYYSAVAGHDISRSPWNPLKARTLAGAKREATRHHGQGYAHHEIVVAKAHEFSGPDGPEIDYRVIARRPMRGDWTDAG